MPCFSEKSGILTASSKGGDFPSRQNEWAGLMLITKTVVFLTVFFFFLYLLAIAGDRVTRLHCQQRTNGTGVYILFPTAANTVSTEISQCLGQKHWDEGEWLLTEFRWYERLQGGWLSEEGEATHQRCSPLLFLSTGLAGFIVIFVFPETLHFQL